MIGRIYYPVACQLGFPASSLCVSTTAHSLPTFTMWILPLLFVLPLVFPVQVNNTIDDASPLVTYRAPAIDRNLTGFDPARLNNGTVEGARDLKPPPSFFDLGGVLVAGHPPSLQAT
ncbi:hypothetical protein B0H19DRAFT_1249236 [Mycena capillaripes]|nr:hypothetical protein B0H19DRAFT_1249236 [Mycena capillaripes]